ncbi:MAG: hypothetical protein ACI4XP_02495 [Acutalibacteraceae bacterium]
MSDHTDSARSEYYTEGFMMGKVASCISVIKNTWKASEEQNQEELIKKIKMISECIDDDIFTRFDWIQAVLYNELRIYK